MVESSNNSQPHRRTRNDHATEKAEDYVEAVADIIEQNMTCRVSDLAKRFDVSHVTVSRLVARLVSENLLDTSPYRPIVLTAKGKRLARRSKQRHEIVYRFLLAIGVDESNATSDSEGIEHHVSAATLASMSHYLESKGV